MEKEISIKELYGKALTYHVEDATPEDVQKFLVMAEKGVRPLAICGWCKNRNTTVCPWPHECKITYPACNTYESRKDGDQTK